MIHVGFVDVLFKDGSLEFLSIFLCHYIMQYQYQSPSKFHYYWHSFCLQALRNSFWGQEISHLFFHISPTHIKYV